MGPVRRQYSIRTVITNNIMVAMWPQTVCLVLVFLCVSAVKSDIAPKGNNISCFVCNSHHSDFCDDPFDITKNGSLDHRKNCIKLFADREKGENRINDTYDFLEETGPHSVPTADTTFFCRKIVQSITGFGAKLEDTRVIRGCAFELREEKYRERKCYYTANQLYTTKVCKCHDGDNCNPASALTGVALLTLLIPTLLLVI